VLGGRRSVESEDKRERVPEGVFEGDDLALVEKDVRGQRLAPVREREHVVHEELLQSHLAIARRLALVHVLRDLE
jgi:hypothetical protein